MVEKLRNHSNHEQMGAVQKVSSLFCFLHLLSQMGRCAMSRDISFLHISRPEGSADGVGEGKNNRCDWDELKENCGDTEARSETEKLAPVISDITHRHDPGYRVNLREPYLV